MSRSHQSLLAFLALSATIALAAWWIVHWCDEATLAVGVPPLVQAEFASLGGASPPGDDADWRATALPDDWQRDARAMVDGWYRLRVRRSDVATPCAVYLPTVHMNAAVWLNGRFLGSGGRFDEPVARNWNRPLLFGIPAGLLGPDENVLLVRVKADRMEDGLLGPVYVGGADLLNSAYARRFFFKVTALRAIALSQGVLLLFLVALWARRRRDTVYGWFAAASLAWSLTWPNLLVVEIPFATRAWLLLWYLAGGWFVVFLVCFALAFVGESNPRLTRGLLVYGVIGSLVLAALAALASPWLEVLGTRAWVAPQYLAGGYAVSRLAAALRREPASFELRVAYVSGLVLVGCAMQDWPMLFGMLGREESFYVPYAAPICQFAMGWILLRRMVGALHRSDALAMDLDARIAAMRRDLEHSETRRRDLERARFLAEERERIMREMHDGLGSQLVSTLALVERGDAPSTTVADAVRSTLDDLRLMVEALEPTDGDLLPALAQLRSRLQPRIETAGVRVVWRAGDMPPIEGMGPGTVLQVLRIVEEAIANVLKHAAARTLAITTGVDATADAGGAIAIEVTDDGRGFGDTPSRGLGMDNMRRRAREMGAVIDIRSSSAGTVVRVRVPLGRRSEETLDPARRR
jgi:signal transduction histidine kinase